MRGPLLAPPAPLRRVFLCGAVAFAISTALASAAQDMVWIIGMRVVQGTSAALMMPTAVAITSAVWPKERRGYALGVLDRGQAAGIINTAEQLGGAIGIAGLGALQLSYYFHLLFARLASRGIHATAAQSDTVRAFIAQAEQKGLNNVPQNSVVRSVFGDLVQSHASHFRSRSTPRRGSPSTARSPAPSWSAGSRTPSTIRSSAGALAGSPPTPPSPRH
jgi:MFS family permease